MGPGHPLDQVRKPRTVLAGCRSSCGCGGPVGRVDSGHLARKSRRRNTDLLRRAVVVVFWGTTPVKSHGGDDWPSLPS